MAKRLQLQELNQEQCCRIVLEFFGGMSKDCYSNNNANNQSFFSISGIDLVFVEELEDLRELGFAMIPEGRLEEAVVEIKRWRDCWDCVVPEDVVRFLDNKECKKESEDGGEVGEDAKEEEVSIVDDSTANRSINADLASSSLLLLSSSSPSPPSSLKATELNLEFLLCEICRQKLRSEGFEVASMFPANNIVMSSISEFTVLQNKYEGVDAWDTLVSILSEFNFLRPVFLMFCKVIVASYQLHEPSIMQLNSMRRILISNLSQFCDDEEDEDDDEDEDEDEDDIFILLKSLHVVLFLIDARTKLILYEEEFILILGCFQKFQKCVSHIQHICSILSILSTLPNFDDNAMKVGLVPAFVHFLNDHSRSPVAMKCGTLTVSSFLSNSTKLQLPFGNCGLHVALINILFANMLDASIVKQSCAAIEHLCFKHDNKELFHNSCSILQKVLEIHQYDPFPLNQICGAIWTLSDNLMNSVEFGHLGTCDVLIDVLHEHIQNPQIINRVCGAICSLTGSIDNRRKVTELGVCDLLCGVLRFHKGARDVAETGCRGIWICLGNESELSSKASIAITDVLVAVLKEHFAVGGVMRNACGALMLTCKLNGLCSNRLNALGCYPLLLEALQFHLTNSAVVETLLPVLQLMVSSCSDNAPLAIPMLLQVVEVHVELPEVLILVCNMFDELGKIPNAFVLVDVSGISILVLALFRYKGDERIVKAVTGVLKQTGLHFNLLTPSNCQRLIGLFHDMLGVHQQCPCIVKHICWIIASVGSPAMNQVDILGLGLCESFCRLMEAYITSSDVILHIFWMVANCVHDRYVVAKKMVEIGLLPMILKVIREHSRSSPIAKYACGMLKDVTSFHSIIHNVVTKDIAFLLVDTMLPVYNQQKVVLKPLLGAVCNLLQFAKDQLRNNHRSDWQRILTEALSYFKADDSKVTEEILRAIQLLRLSRVVVY